MPRRGPKDWDPKRIGLDHILKTRARDNHGYEYQVTLKFERSDIMGWKWLLRIENTPGHWYMSTLLEHGYPRQSGIAIDAGQNWNIINFDAIMTEAVDLI